MKHRIIKIVPILALITSVIYLCSCERSYDANNIPNSSTDMNKAGENYNNNSANVRTEATGTVQADSSNQMLPANSTGAPQVEEKK